MTNAPLLTVDRVSVSFQGPKGRGRVRAVNDVSLELEPGGALGIVGESGSGKSVLSRTIMGLTTARQADVTGEVMFAGRSILGLSPRQMRTVWGDGMAMIFQDPMTSLNPVMRIGRQVEEALESRGRSAANGRGPAELLASVGIPDPERRLRQYPHHLSGGLRQRVVIAIALSRDPMLLIADEPTTALDVTTQAVVLDLLSTEQESRAMAMILVTHDVGVVAERTSHLAVMYAGRIVEWGPTASVLRRPRMPYTQALQAAVPRLDDPPHTRLQAVPGRPPNPSSLPAGCPFHPRCQFAQPVCAAQRPPLVADAADERRRYACWFPLSDHEPQRGAGPVERPSAAERV